MLLAARERHWENWKYGVSRWKKDANSDMCGEPSVRLISSWRESGTWVFSDFIASFAEILWGERGEHEQRKRVAVILESCGKCCWGEDLTRQSSAQREKETKLRWNTAGSRASWRIRTYLRQPQTRSRVQCYEINCSGISFVRTRLSKNGFRC